MRKTYRDRLMLGLSIAPPLALGLFCVTAAARWQVNSGKVREVAERSFAPELVDAFSPAAKDYDDRTSSEYTKTYRELIAGLDAINDKYSMMFGLVDEDMDWFTDLSVERPTENAVRSYLQEAAPHLRLIKELHADLVSTWTPHETGNPNSYVGAIVAGRGISDLLRLEFRAAVRSKETARAIEALELFQATQPGVSTLNSHQMLPLVIDSMTTGIWSDEDLDQITKMIDNGDDLDQVWELNVRGGILGQIPWLLSGKDATTWRPDPIPRTYAPSERITWLKRQERYLGIDKMGTFRAVKDVLEIDSDELTASANDLDAAIQIPLYGRDDDRGGSKEYLARMYCKEANERRVVKTAIAIARYKIQFGTYPEQLGQLVEVGLSGYDRLDPLGREFLFVSDGQQCSLSNASEWFQPRFGSSLSFVDTPSTLGSLLQDYRQVKFMSDSAVKVDDQADLSE